MKDYEINSSTLAILPIDENKSMVYEQEAEYVVERSTNSIIKDNCEFYGSSYQGRCKGTKKLTGIKAKFPIIIEESRDMIFFPTNSIRNSQSIWISLNNIKEYKKNKYSSEVLFKNNISIKLDISFYILENQICRAALLKSKLHDIKQKEK